MPAARRWPRVLPLDVTDFGAAISKIQAASPDFIWSALVGGAHMSFYRQWKATGMTGKIPLASTVRRRQ